MVIWQCLLFIFFKHFFNKDTLHEGSGLGQIQDWREKASHLNLGLGNFSQSDFCTNFGNKIIKFA